MAYAVHKSARISAQKVRLVAREVSGKKVDLAVRYLTFSNKKAASLIAKVLNSAIANAVHNEQLNETNLYVRKIFCK